MAAAKKIGLNKGAQAKSADKKALTKGETIVAYLIGKGDLIGLFFS